MENEKKPEEDVKQSFLEAVKRNEEILKEMKELTERNEQLAARNLLGGNSQAGQEKSKDPELTPKEYLKSVIALKK